MQPSEFTSEDPGLDRAGFEKWLEDYGLNFKQMSESSPNQKARLVRLLVPDSARDIEQTEREALHTIGELTWRNHNIAENGNKSLLLALLDLFTCIGETEKAALIFGTVYPEPVFNQVTYYQRSARLSLSMGNTLEALEAAVDLRRAFPAAITTFALLADLLILMSDFEGAKKCYSQALEVSPESPTALLGLAKVALQKQDFEQVRLLAVQIEAQDRVSWRTLRQLAYIYQELGEIEKAKTLTIKAYEWRKSGIEAVLQDKEKGEEPLQVEEVFEGILVQAPEGQSEIQSSAKLTPESFETLFSAFGFKDFKPGQEEVIANVLAGMDTLAVLPTGGGKSLCYQLPALSLDRPVLVISPLISLMKDQFDKLPPQLKEQSAVINSSLEPGEAAKILQKLGDTARPLKLIYAAPERLRQYTFVRAMAKAGLGLLVVDEAHCVTLWGNDFRPDYLFIRPVLRDLSSEGRPPTLLAVTATATPAIAVEISNQLGRPLNTVRGTMHRPNLFYRVVKPAKTERDTWLVDLCREREGSGIIYVRSRDNTERLAALLQRSGVNAGFYHAGMTNSARRHTQENWSSGNLKVVVATVAFGMGIDKPDVRFIIHYNLSDSVENYVQESGRAGRDGLPSECILFYAPAEKGNLTRFQRSDAVDINTLRLIFASVKKALGSRKIGIVELDELSRNLNPVRREYEEPIVSENQIKTGLSLLERAGLLTRYYDFPTSAEVTLLEENLPRTLADFALATALSRGQSQTVDLIGAFHKLNLAPTTVEPQLLEWVEDSLIRCRFGKREMLLELTPVSRNGNAAEQVNKLLEELEMVHLKRVEQIADYSKSTRCRHAFLARHFGERLPTSNCGACDNCFPAKSEGHELASSSTLSQRFAEASPSFPDDLIFTVLHSIGSLNSGSEMGKSGLNALLLGKETGPQSERQNPEWGRLGGKLRVKEVEALIDSTISKNLIEPHEVVNRYGQTYSALMLSEKGKAWLEEYKPSPAAQNLLSTSLEYNALKETAALTSEAYALIVLRCLGNLEPTAISAPKIGRSGLVRLLMGQPSALGTTSSNPLKGAFAGKMKQIEVEALIERLVLEGYIEQQPSHLASGRTYNALGLSHKGRGVVEENQ